MYSLFNSKNPLLNVLFPVLSALMFIILPADVILNYYSYQGETYLYKALLKSFDSSFYVPIYKTTGAVLTAFNAVFFSQMIIKIKFFKIYNNFHGYIFLFILGLLIRFTDVLPVLISISFFLFALFILFRTLRKQYALFDLFNVGFLISIGSLFSFELLYFIPFIYAGLIILRSVNMREWLVALIGLLTPYFIGVSLYYFVNSDFMIVIDIISLISNNEQIPDLNLITIIALFMIGLITLVSTFQIFAGYRSKETDIQDYLRIFFVIFLTALGIIIIAPGMNYTAIGISVITFTIPVSMFLKNLKRKILREILFDIFLLSMIFVHVEFFQSWKI